MTVSLASASLKSRKTGHCSGGSIASVGSVLEAGGPPVCPKGFPYPSTVTGAVPKGAPVGPDPYPSTVTGAVPAGAPVTVSWAAAGVADKTAQTAAVDRNVKTKCFIRLSPAIDRERSKSRLATTAL